MPPINRRSAPRVIRGAVQKKNNWDLSEDYYRAPRRWEVVVDRQRPGAGYRHILNKSDIYRFLELLPEWDDLAVGLHAIVLAEGEHDCYGYHKPGVVHVCAWSARMWEVSPRSFYDDNRQVLDRIGVEAQPLWQYISELEYEFQASDSARDIFGRYPWDWILCKFTERQARAFLLLDVLLHELGHHHDRITTRSRRVSRGEPYAEQYARTHCDLIWDRYVRVFSVD